MSALKPLNRSTAGITATRPVKIIQFGSGNFLRAFADWFVDILNEKTDFNGGIRIIQSVSQDSALNEQQGLYHVITRGLREGKFVDEARLITSVAGAMNPQDDMREFISLSHNHDWKFVISNTTESGITFNGDDMLVGPAPSTFPGKLAILLYHRFKFYKAAQDKGIIILPCELVEKNGELLKEMILRYSSHWKLGNAFDNWITDHNFFCNTLVDRIVPGFPKEKSEEIKQSLGFDDQLLVMAEPFHLWVIDAPDHVQKLFPVDKLGLTAIYSNNIDAYRTRKVRILNGAHTTLVPVAYLKGFRTVRESVEDTEIGSFLRTAITEEIIPTLDLPSDELHSFAGDVLERFLNPYIKHQLISISLNSISKYKVRVLPSVLRYIDITGKPPQKLLFSLAALIVFYKGIWKQESIPLSDSPEVLDFFKKAWKSSSIEETARMILSNTSFWGEDLTKLSGLEDCVVSHLRSFGNEVMDISRR